MKLACKITAIIMSLITICIILKAILITVFFYRTYKKDAEFREIIKRERDLYKYR